MCDLFRAAPDHCKSPVFIQQKVLVHLTVPHQVAAFASSLDSDLLAVLVPHRNRVRMPIPGVQHLAYAAVVRPTRAEGALCGVRRLGRKFGAQPLCVQDPRLGRYIYPVSCPVLQRCDLPKAFLADHHHVLLGHHDERLDAFFHVLDSRRIVCIPSREYAVDRFCPGRYAPIWKVGNFNHHVWVELRHVLRLIDRGANVTLHTLQILENYECWSGFRLILHVVVVPAAVQG